MIDFIGFIYGVFIGFFWLPVFNFSYLKLDYFFRRKYKGDYSFLVAICACLLAMLFFMSGMIFSPFISEEAWVFFHKKLLLGFCVGVCLQKLKQLRA